MNKTIKIILLFLLFILVAFLLLNILATSLKVKQVNHSQYLYLKCLSECPTYFNEEYNETMFVGNNLGVCNAYSFEYSSSFMSKNHNKFIINSEPNHKCMSHIMSGEADKYKSCLLEALPKLKEEYQIKDD